MAETADRSGKAKSLVGVSAMMINQVTPVVSSFNLYYLLYSQSVTFAQEILYTYEIKMEKITLFRQTWAVVIQCFRLSRNLAFIL